MSETTMPAVEAQAVTDERELASYELAFHVLPTIAEGEVSKVFQKLKDVIAKNGGVVTVEEAPARFDLAYEISKYLEGRNRKFSSAYFGWVRFEAEPEKLAKIKSSVSGTKELLRHLLIKLDRVEAENPFFFHEELSKHQKIENIDLDDAEIESEDEVVDGVEDDSVEVEIINPKVEAGAEEVGKV
jgi:ribosomal protein S6